MKFTWKDYSATFIALAVIALVLYLFFKFIPVQLDWLPILLISVIFFLLSLCLYAKILRTFVPFKDSVFSANDDSINCFVWKQTVFTYEWTASILSYITPVLLRPVLYKLLGAKLGKGVLIAGKIVEPQMVTIGDYSNIGEIALLMAHAIVKDGVVLKHIKIGNRVAIGAHSVIMPGAEIGDGSIVGACALVLTDTKIPPNEVWGGVPARKLKDIEPS